MAGRSSLAGPVFTWQGRSENERRRNLGAFSTRRRGEARPRCSVLQATNEGAGAKRSLAELASRSRYGSRSSCPGKGGNERTALPRLLHRVEQVDSEAQFHHVADAACLLRRHDEILIVMNGQKDDGSRGAFRAQAGRHLQTRHPWHRDIKDDDIRVQGSGCLECLQSALDGADYRAGGGQCRGRAHEHDVAVVDEQHPRSVGRSGAGAGWHGHGQGALIVPVSSEWKVAGPCLRLQRCSCPPRRGVVPSPRAASPRRAWNGGENFRRTPRLAHPY